MAFVRIHANLYFLGISERILASLTKILYWLHVTIHDVTNTVDDVTIMQPIYDILHAAVHRNGDKLCVFHPFPRIFLRKCSRSFISHLSRYTMSQIRYTMSQSRNPHMTFCQPTCARIEIKHLKFFVFHQFLRIFLRKSSRSYIFHLSRYTMSQIRYTMSQSRDPHMTFRVQTYNRIEAKCLK